MTEQIKLTTVRRRIGTALASIQTDQIINMTHSEDYNTTIFRSDMEHFSDQYADRLCVTEMIHCFTKISILNTTVMIDDRLCV